MVGVLGVLAASWGVLMAIAPLLQIRRMRERHSSRDVSMAYLGVLQFGFALWIAYGVSLENPAIILPNSVAFVVGVVTMAVAWRYRTGVIGGP